LTKFAEAFTPLGVTQANKNSFSGGSYTIEDAKLVGLDYNNRGGGAHDDGEENNNSITLEVNVNVRGERTLRMESVQVLLG